MRKNCAPSVYRFRSHRLHRAENSRVPEISYKCLRSACRHRQKWWKEALERKEAVRRLKIVIDGNRVYGHPRADIKPIAHRKTSLNAAQRKKKFI